MWFLRTILRMNSLASMGICATRRKKGKECVCPTRVVVGSWWSDVLGDVSASLGLLGTVDHGGFYRELWWCWWLLPRWWGGPPGGCCPCYQWTGCSWWALPVLPMNQAYFPNVALRLPLAWVVTPCFWVPDPQDLRGTDCVRYRRRASRKAIRRQKRVS